MSKQHTYAQESSASTDSFGLSSFLPQRLASLKFPWKKGHQTSAEANRPKPRRVLSPWTLRFKRIDFERFYMEHHWAHMRYWLWWSVAWGLFYTAISILVGDDVIAKTFDVRMDHYTRTSWEQEDGPSALQSVNMSETDTNLWSRVKVVKLDEDRYMEIPRGGFLAWHLIWSLLFLVILLLDRFQKRCFCSSRGRWFWAFARTWLAFGVMFLDLVITSFLNASVTRFMMFVYALLIRVQFVQTVVLVLLSSGALLSAGYIGSHEFLNSISVAEFLVLNLVCLSAARQTEIHARLSLYRLWYIMMTNKSGASREIHENISEAELARNVLSLRELALEPILEDEAEELETEVLQTEGMRAPAEDLEAGPPMSKENSDASASHSPGYSGTPNSHAMSIGSAANDPKPQRVTPRRNSFKGILGRHSPKDASGTPPRGRGSKRRHRSGTVSPEQSSDSGSDNRSECGSFCSDFIMDQTRPSPWICLKAGKEMPRQCAPDDFDAEDSWAEVNDVERYELRGPTYLQDGIKIPAKPCAFSVHQIRIIKTEDALLDAGKNLPSLSSFLKSHPKHFFFIYNRVVPYGRTGVINVITLMVRRMASSEDKAFDVLLGRYMAGDEIFRNNRLKYLYKIRDAPSSVHGALRTFGKERPVVIGNKGHMNQRNYTGSNYVEVDVDTSSSWLARMVVGKVSSNAAKLLIEEMLVLEGQADTELPERPLAAWRWVHLNPDNCMIDLAACESYAGDFGQELFPSETVSHQDVDAPTKPESTSKLML